MQGRKDLLFLTTKKKVTPRHDDEQMLPCSQEGRAELGRRSMAQTYDLQGGKANARSLLYSHQDHDTQLP